MTTFYIVEVAQHQMCQVYKATTTLGAYITMTNNRDDIQQFLNDRFGTFGKVYDFDIHTFDLSEVKENCLTPIFWYDGHTMTME